MSRPGMGFWCVGGHACITAIPYNSKKIQESINRLKEFNESLARNSGVDSSRQLQENLGSWGLPLILVLIAALLCLGVFTLYLIRRQRRREAEWLSAEGGNQTLRAGWQEV